MMFKRMRAVILLMAAFVAGTFVQVAWTQQGPSQGTTEYVVVNYMRVPPGKGEAYVALERDIFKAGHQARVRDGKLKSWSLWQKRFGGTEDGYSYITVNTYSRFEDIEFPPQEYIQKANPGRNMTDIQRQTQEAREIVRTEVWRVIDQTK